MKKINAAGPYVSAQHKPPIGKPVLVCRRSGDYDVASWDGLRWVRGFVPLGSSNPVVAWAEINIIDSRSDLRYNSQ